MPLSQLLSIFPARVLGHDLALSAPPSRRTADESTTSQDKRVSFTTTSSVTDLEKVASFDATSKDLCSQDFRVHRLSTVRLLFAHIGAALTLFLATTDATIVSTSLPTITSDLGATQNQYTWVGVAYMLTQTACQPLYGRISDLVGRKVLLYTSMIIFATGSLLCGAAQNIIWLCIARGVAGVGGGGIVSSVWVITSEIVDVESRAKWSQALSVTWACSAIAGPLLGGVFSAGQSSTLSWRWAFYLNLPVCVFGAFILFLSLRDVEFDCAKDASWNAFITKFDFLGLILFIGGTSAIIVGFSFASEQGWSSASTLSLLILGLVVLVCGGFYEIHTKRDALFPAAMFKHVTTVLILIVSFLHNFAFNAGTFYLALYFQAVNGSSPLEAGLRLLPYSLGSSLASMPAAWFIGYWQRKSHKISGQKLVICLGLLIATIGFGLLNLLHEQSPNSLQCVFPLIAGLGLGMLFHAPYQVFTNALRPEELATGTSAFFLVRFTGATTGLAVAGAIYEGRLMHTLPSGYEAAMHGFSLSVDSLSHIEPLQLRWEVIHAVSSSIQTIWMVCAPCLGVALLFGLFLRSLHNDRPVEDPKPEQKPADSS